MNVLRGKKVVLRPVEKKDLPLALKWFNDQEVIQYLQFFFPLTEMAEDKWFERVSLSENDAVFAIDVFFEDGTTRTIGTCGLHQIKWKDRCATAGIAIGEKEFWSQGYGSEAVELLIEYAFQSLNLHRISAAVYDFNERSLRTQLRLGFKEEGRRREAIFKNGRYCDEILTGLLRKDWEKRQG